MPEPGEADDRGPRFDALFAAYFAEVRAYVVRRAGGTPVDDVLSETFLVAWRRLDAVPADGLPWLLGVARRVLANQRRGDARRAALIDRLATRPPRARPQPRHRQRPVSSQIPATAKPRPRRSAAPGCPSSIRA